MLGTLNKEALKFIPLMLMTDPPNHGRENVGAFAATSGNVHCVR